DVIKVVTATLRLPIDLIHGDWKKAWDDLKTIVGGSLDIVKTLLENTAANLKALGAALGTAVKNGIEDGLTGIGGWLLGVMNGLKDILTNKVSDVSAAAASVGSAAFHGMTDKIGDIVKFWRDMPGQVASAIGD